MKKATDPIAPKDMNFGWALQGDRIAVLRVDKEEVSKGGIIIPDTAKEERNFGFLAAMGETITHAEDGTRLRSCPYELGQLIQFGKYAGSEIQGDDNREYLVIREHDILAYRPKK